MQKQPPMSTTDLRSKRIILTGGAGFLGRAVRSILLARGVPDDRIFVPRSAQIDLTQQDATRRLFAEAFAGEPVDLVIHCAGRVGGLGANRAKPANFFVDNMAMALNLVDAARRSGFIDRAGKFVMVGSMTSYPAQAQAPFREDDLYNGYPDAASAPYGIAKLAALEMLRACHAQLGLKAAYVVPVNLYGPGDNIDPATSHFVGALVDRCVRAIREKSPTLECWGTGSPTREFLYVDDAAEGVVRAAELIDDPTPINLGSGEEFSIREVVDAVVEQSGYRGEVVWDATKPDGVGRRCLDSTRARKLLGWTAAISLEEGLRRTIEWRRSLRKDA